MTQAATQSLPPFRRPRLALGVAGLALLLALAIGVLVVARDGAPFAIDRGWMDTLLHVRTPFGQTLGLIMNDLGGNVLGTYGIPLAIVIALVWRRRFWSAGYFVAAALGATIVVQIVKHLVGRERPGDIIVHSDFGSFPSGHASHAAVIAVVAFVFFPRFWVAIAGIAWVLLMALSRNYLGAHWLSDVVAGALIGGAVAVIVLWPFAVRVADEWNRTSQHPDSMREH